MKKLKTLFVIIPILAIWAFIYLEFPFNDEGIVFKDTRYTFRIPSLSEAQNALTTDTIDNFFEKISVVDLALQMKMNSDSLAKNENAKVIYQNYLKSQIIKFKLFEIQKLKFIANEVSKKLEAKISGSIPNDIEFVKLTQNIYGENVFFTRNTTIFLTEDFFKLNTQQQRQTFAHELSHILSRYVKGYKEKLYPTIGFEKLDQIINYDSIYDYKEKVLLNPDGVTNSWSYSIEPKNDIWFGFSRSRLIPAIFAKEKSLENKNYLSNIEFKLIEAELSKKPIFKFAGWKEDVYINQFKENYGVTYTIHPDEIIAELFSKWLLDEEKNLVPTLSGRGLKSLKYQTFEEFTDVLNKQRE